MEMSLIINILRPFSSHETQIWIDDFICDPSPVKELSASFFTECISNCPCVLHRRSYASDYHPTFLTTFHPLSPFDHSTIYKSSNDINLPHYLLYVYSINRFMIKLECLFLLLLQTQSFFVEVSHNVL